MEIKAMCEQTGGVTAISECSMYVVYYSTRVWRVFVLELVTRYPLHGTPHTVLLTADWSKLEK